MKKINNYMFNVDCIIILRYCMALESGLPISPR